MKFDGWFIFTLVHLILATIYAIFILAGRSYLRKDFITIIYLTPIAGIVAALVVEYLNIKGKQGSEDIDLPATKLDDDILWKSLKNVDEEGNIIPLEEALLINDHRTRREMILKTLRDDPMKYLDILMIARHNEDVETSHYATTIISNAQRDFENEIQSLSAELGKNPEDIHTINRHIESVEAYIDSGLLEEYLLKNQRISYSQLLDQKLKILPTDKSTLIKKIRNHLELNEPYEAVEAWEILRENYTDDEDIWIEGVRISVESHDKRRLQDTLAQINSSEIDWSISGRSRLENWLESK